MIQIHHSKTSFIVCENGFITILYVDAKDRNKGIGTELLQKCITEAKKQGLTKLWLIAEPAEKENKKKLTRFYQQNGFEEVNNKMEIRI